MQPSLPSVLRALTFPSCKSGPVRRWLLLALPQPHPPFCCLSGRSRYLGWVESYSMFVSGFFHLSLNVFRVHPCCNRCQNFMSLGGWIIFHCIYSPHFAYLSVNGHSSWFHPLTTLNNAIMNTGVRVSIWVPAYNTRWYTPRRGIAGSYGNCMFNFLRNMYLSLCMKSIILRWEAH